MDTEKFMVYIKGEVIYGDIAKDVETRFDTSSYKLERTLPKGRNEKVIGLMKDDMDGKIIREFAALRPKTYRYLTDDNDKNKKT